MNYRSTTNQRILGNFVEREVIINASMLVTDLLDKGLLQYEDIENQYYYACTQCGGEMTEIKHSTADSYNFICKKCGYGQYDQPEQEIYEWWFVTEWLFKKLQVHGEPVIDSRFGYLWGRCTTGQAILLDYVIGEIAEELEILEGQRNDWSKQ